MSNDKDSAIVPQREKLGAVTANLEVPLEHLVKSAKYEYIKNIKTEEERATKLIEKLEGELREANKAIETYQDKVAPEEFEVHVKELFAGLKKFGISKPKIEVKIRLRLEEKHDGGYYHGNSWRQAKTTKQKPVSVNVTASWDGGDLHHHMSRKLSKAEREMMDHQKALIDQIAEAKKILFKLDTAKSEYALVTDYVEGAIAKAKVKEVAPELLGMISIEGEFTLPTIDGLKALPAPKAKAKAKKKK